jgi:glycosyltransferase involved in cell wall biosynthesis
MRILIYNFVQPGASKAKQGGGVAIYQDNLIKALREQGHAPIVMSCGDRYSLRGGRAFLTTGNDGFERAVIVDSPVVAPAHYTFHKIESYYEDTGLDHIPAQLRSNYGEIDVFHFQNVEGLSAGFFRALRKEYPQARLLLSAHNYNLVCPQVNLWYREHKACDDYREGRSCVNCVLSEDLQPAVINLRRLETILLNLRIEPKSRAAKAVEAAVRAPFRLRRRLLRYLPTKANPGGAAAPIIVTSAEKAAKYRRYREENIRLVREVFDRVIAVSERTRQVLVERGVPAERVDVSYIGTAQYPAFLRSRKITDAQDHIHIAFLGYMRADKGFYFLLDALFSLHEEWAKRVSLTIAAPLWDQGVVGRLREMAYKFRDIRIFDGYSHKTLDRILEGVNLGVVPVLWEDNLPQVAIEMAARGIPLLTSDKGGAQEIGSDPDFIFRSGSKSDFCTKLQRLVSGDVPLGTFWEKPTTIRSMEDHLAELMRFYRGQAGTGVDAGHKIAASAGHTLPAEGGGGWSAKIATAP